MTTALELPLAPRWVYTDATGAVDFHMALPQRAWTVGALDVGGSDVSGAGVPAAFRIRRDSIWRLTLRFREREWGNVERLLAHLQGAGSVTFYPDRLRAESHTLYLVSPAMGEEVAPRPGDEPSTQELDITVRPTTSAVVRRRYYSRALWRFSAGDDARQVTFTRSGAIGARRNFEGRLEQLAANQLRTTWRSVNGVWQPLTLLEAPASNGFLRSNELDNAAWTKSACSIVANQSQGPTDLPGVETLDKIVEDSANTAHLVSQAATLTADAVYALSAFMLADTRTWAFLDFLNGANVVRAFFNMATGAVGTLEDEGTGLAVRAYVEDFKRTFPGLYRCVVVGLVGSGATSISGRVALTTGDGITTYLGDGTSAIRAGCLQLEEGVVASSYIPTTTGVASRGAEAFTDAFTYTPREIAEMGGATIYLDFVEGLAPNWVQEGGSTLRLVNIGAHGGTAPRSYLIRPAGGDSYTFAYDPSSAVESTVDLNPSRLDRIQLAAQFIPSADKRSLSVKLLGRKNGTTNATGAQSSNAVALSAFSDDVIALGGLSTSGRGNQEYDDAIVFPGVLDIDECEHEARAA
jgi:hypothetical protein